MNYSCMNQQGKYENHNVELLRNSYGMVFFLIITDVYTFTVVKSAVKSKGKFHSTFKTVIISKDTKLYIGRDQWRL